MSALVINFIVIAIFVVGWTAAVWAFYTHLDDSPAQAKTARGHEVTTRKDVRRAA